MGPSTSASREKTLEVLRERILNYAASKVGRDRAEDIAQETFLLLLQKYPAIQDELELIKLGTTIAGYKILETFRPTRTVGTPVEEMTLADPDDTPDHLLLQKELFTSLKDVLPHLGERCRELFLYRLQDLPFPEIQKRMKVDSINTVYTWDSRCRQEARKLLERKYRGTR